MNNQNNFSIDELFNEPHAENWVPNTEQALRRFQQRRDSVRLRRKKIAWIGGTIAAMGLVSMSIPPTRAYAQKCVDACMGETSRVTQFILHKMLPAHGERQMAPNFELVDADGGTVKLSALRGKVVVLNFWATWCRPCGAEIPWFMEFHRDLKERGLSVVGVSVDEEGWAKVRPFAAKLNVNYPLVIGGEDLIQQYGGLDSLPTTLLIDRRGRVAVTHIGLVSKQTYESDIQRILNEAF